MDADAVDEIIIKNNIKAADAMIIEFNFFLLFTYFPFFTLIFYLSLFISLMLLTFD